MSELDYYFARKSINAALSDLTSAQYHLSQHSEDTTGYSLKIETVIKRLNELDQLLGSETADLARRIRKLSRQ